jgi:uncharacterized membrane protein
VSKQTDIRDIVLFIVGILFLIFPPAWSVKWDSWAERNEILNVFLMVMFVAGVYFIGCFIRNIRNR